jgi:hypothetical protein
MEKLDLKGIVWIPARKKYRVLLTRKGVEYVIGHFVEVEEAIVARDTFLLEYKDANYLDKHEPPKYSKAWFKWKHKQQLEDFKKYDGSNGTKYIIFGNEYEFDRSKSKSVSHMSASLWDLSGDDPWSNQ